MRLKLALAPCMLAAACAAPEPAAVSSPTAASAAAPASSPSTSASTSHAEELFAYLGRLRTMNEAALGAEAARMRRGSSELARVKAALALSLSAQADESDILELVEPVTRRSGGDRDLRAMASLLQAMATERRKLRQRAAAAAGELREERRTAETQKQRAEQLQQKLDALTELEKSLATREKESR